jgi:hypothetical protein
MLTLFANDRDLPLPQTIDPDTYVLPPELEVNYILEYFTDEAHVYAREHYDAYLALIDNEDADPDEVARITDLAIVAAYEAT